MSSGGDEPVADSGPLGTGHSVFANAVLKFLSEMEDEQFTAGDLFPRIKRGVAGRSPQIPQYNFIRNSGDEYGDFVFSRSGKGVVVAHDTGGVAGGANVADETFVSANSNNTTKPETHAGSLALDAQRPVALGPGVNKGNVDNGSGPHYYYFWAGPGHVDIKMAFKEMGVLGAPFRQGLTFDLYDEGGKVVSHSTIVSLANLERIKTGGDFGSRHRMTLAVVPQKGLVRLGGYYEIEVTGAAAFDGAASATTAVKPEDTALYHSAGSLYQPGTELYKPGQALVVSETEKEVRVVMAADVLFDFDKAMIRPDAASALKQAAAVIREKHRAIVRIEGYTDSRGGTVHNMQLSRQRAVAVENWLVQNEGFDVAIFRTQGFGAARPVAPNVKPDGSDNPEGRQRNRRVELLIAK